MEGAAGLRVDAFDGAASGLWVLIATQFLFGMGEAGAYPNMSGVVARVVVDLRNRRRAAGQRGAAVAHQRRTIAFCGS